MRAQLRAGTAGQPAWYLPSVWRPRVDREVCPGTVRKATGLRWAFVTIQVPRGIEKQPIRLLAANSWNWGSN